MQKTSHNLKKFAIATLFLLGIFFVSSLVSAAGYTALILSNSKPVVSSTNNAQTSFDDTTTYDLDPGDTLTGTGTLTWTAGFVGGLPAMGLGSPGSGAVPLSYPFDFCSASSSYPGNINPHPNFNTTTARICEIEFNTPYAGTGTASYNIRASANAVRGSVWAFGLNANGGSTPLEKDFNIRIKPKINSFTCDTGATATTLSWDLSGYSSALVTKPDGTSFPISGTGVGNATPITLGGIYTLTTETDVSTASCTIPTATPVLNVTVPASVSATPGQNTTVPFTFSNDGPVGSKVHIIGCDYATPPPTGSLPPNCPPIDLNN